MAATPISSAQFDAPAPRHLNWMRREGTSWCGLYDVCLEGVRDIGVFVIWHASDPRRWVKVGQGHIADCIAMQRDDFAIARYRHLGLHVAWAAVSMAEIDGVEAYLAIVCRPLIRDASPDSVPIPVDLPRH